MARLEGGLPAVLDREGRGHETVEEGMRPLGNLALELSLADEDMRAAVVREYAVWREAISDKLSADIAQGKARYAADDPAAFATFVVALFTGAMTIAKAEQVSVALAACGTQLRAIMHADL